MLTAPHCFSGGVPLQHLLNVYLTLSRYERHGVFALQVPHPSPHPPRLSDAEPIQTQEDVRLAGRSNDAVLLHPAPLYQALAHSFHPGYCSHRRLTRPASHALPQSRRCPPSRPAGWIRLREHLAAVPAAEAPFPECQPDGLLPEPGVPLSLQVPLVDLPRRAAAPGAVRFSGTVLPNNFDPTLLFFHAEHDYLRQPQLDADTIVLHLTSFCSCRFQLQKRQVLFAKATKLYPH
jgi:hypothetical protein